MAEGKDKGKLLEVKDLHVSFFTQALEWTEQTAVSLIAVDF